MSSESYLLKAIDISCLFLPGECPIVKHYISTYNKYYSQELPVIEESMNIEREITVVKANTYDNLNDTVFIKYSIPSISPENNDKQPQHVSSEGDKTTKSS